MLTQSFPDQPGPVTGEISGLQFYSIRELSFEACKSSALIFSLSSYDVVFCLLANSMTTGQSPRWRLTLRPFQHRWSSILEHNK